MAIITISRELAALGDETAQELAKLLNYRFVDKQALEERIKSYGVAGRKFEKYDERKPSFWASLSQDRDDYLHYLKTAIFAEAEEGSCVFIGRGASVVFRNVPGVLSIFLVAPYEIRAERVKSYFHCDDKRVRQIIDQSDHDRTGFHRYFFDMDWKDPGNYHLSLNTGRLHPAICAEIIKNLKDRVFTPETEAQNTARLKELTLGQQVKHHIIYEREIPIHFLEASVSNNMVILYGVANSQSLVEAALAAARDVAASASVQTEIQIVQEYSVMP
ncbi:MAG: cytidylate kinase-like family protein [Treponema sp.]|jgi:cytidylate kinase|nr:cytidylate kinase-like family protein [Treponema sp.]